MAWRGWPRRITSAGAARQALEQIEPQIALQLADLGAQGRLRCAARLGSAAEMQEAGDGGDILQVAQRQPGQASAHRQPLSVCECLSEIILLI